MLEDKSIRVINKEIDQHKPFFLFLVFRNSLFYRIYILLFLEFIFPVYLMSIFDLINLLIWVIDFFFRSR